MSDTRRDFNKIIYDGFREILTPSPDASAAQWLDWAAVAGAVTGLSTIAREGLSVNGACIAVCRAYASKWLADPSDDA